MKTELRIAKHMLKRGANVVEIWHDGNFIGEVTGSDTFPGVRVITKYPMAIADRPGLPNYMDVKIAYLNSTLRRETPETFSPEAIAEMRAEVAKGAGHECSEWYADDGRCQLCDRRRAFTRQKDPQIAIIEMVLENAAGLTKKDYADLIAIIVEDYGADKEDWVPVLEKLKAKLKAAANG